MSAADLNERRLGDQPGAEPHIDEMRPAPAPVRLAQRRDVRCAQRLGRHAFGLGFGQPGRRRHPVAAVPGGGIGLQIGDHGRQGVGQPMPGPPAEQPLRFADVERIMIVRHVDHERADERLLDGVGNDRLQPVLRPDAGRGDGLGDAQRRPVLLAMDQAAEPVLDVVIAERLGLADQHRLHVGERIAPVDGGDEGGDHVLAVQHRLADIVGAGIEIALGAAVIDARHLLGERRHHRRVVIDAGEAEDGDRDRPPLFGDRAFRRCFRPRIGPARVDRPSLVDPLARRAGSVDQHRRGIDEPADIERLQLAKKRAGAGDVHLIVQRIGRAGEIIIGDQMDDAVDPRAIFRPQPGKGVGHRLLGREVGGKDRDRSRLRVPVEADHPEAVGERGRQRAPDIAARAGDEDERLRAVGHVFPLWLIRPANAAAAGIVPAKREPGQRGRRPCPLPAAQDRGPGRASRTGSPAGRTVRRGRGIAMQPAARLCA